MNKPKEFWVKTDKVIIDEDMLPIILKYTWHIRKDKLTKYAFTNVKIGNKNFGVSMHRLLTGMSSSEVDHINRNGLDNRISNLRFATKQQNSYNRVRKNKYGYRGVFKPKKSPHYSFQIQFNGKKFTKNGFKTAEDAARAYDLKNKELHGEFGIRNFED